MLLKQFLEEEEKPKVKAPPKKPRTPKEPKVKVEKAKKEPKPKPSKSVKIDMSGPSGPKIEEVILFITCMILYFFTYNIIYVTFKPHNQLVQLNFFES